MHVYERVREYIEEQGLTESDVAEAAGIPNVTFSAMMSGKKRCMRMTSGRCAWR